MVLNHAAYPSVENWQVKIYENTYTGGSKTSTLIKNYRLGGLNYLLIPTEFYQPQEGTGIDYSFSVTGFNSSGVVVNQGPMNLCEGCVPPNFDVINKWSCNGKRTAWEIQLWRNTNSPEDDPVSGGHYFLTLRPALNYSTSDYGGNAVPYYEWATPSWLEAICGEEYGPSHTELRGFYGLNFIDCELINQYGSGRKIVTRFANNSHGLRDAQCASITGPIYGIQKYLGDWRGSASALADIGSSNIGGYSRAELITFVNNNDVFDLSTALNCDICVNAPNWSNSGWWGHNPNKPIKPGWWTPKFPGISKPGNNLFASIDYVAEIAGGEPLVINNEYSWYSNLLALQIARVDKPGVSVLLERDKLFDENGIFIAPSVVLVPGLYRFEFIHEDLNGIALMYECERDEDNTLYDKDFLNVVLFPVPMQQYGISMNLNALAKVDFEYTLFDPELRVIHKQSFRLKKEYEGTYSVEGGLIGAGMWPNGNYIHQFTFADGSVKSYVTHKL